MLKLTFGEAGRDVRRVLALGAHADDIEIGCGGTLLSLSQSPHDLEVRWVVLSGSGVRADEARHSAETWLHPPATAVVTLGGFEDGFFPYQGASIKRFFEELKAEVQPDLVLTHYRDDRHQDHRLVSELTWNTFRDHLILEYEIPKYDGDFGSPNVFVHLSEEICQRKIDGLLERFASQRERAWFTEDMFRSVLRIRGMESNSPSRYAEGFYGRKIIAAA